jgi:hypothetical protein
MRFRVVAAGAVGVMATLAVTLPAAAVSHEANVSKATAGKQYLALVTPANTALTNFGGQAKTWTNSTPNSQVETAAAPVIATLSSISNGLKHDRWPSSSQTDIKRLEKSVTRVSTDLKSLATVTSFNATTWASKFAKDAHTLNSTATAVRKNLGLPATT